ncbi:hemerythrin domain-containing protein [Aquabacterium sp. J223]|uniref:hemerythrin domain-containing protein n=1 Tax=Aquabacterium sp. J223 TaxID=2898431 RepID=UPI0021ADC01D|nr:hemerythrin domain-containing protein [Aquabacterium sp. J223]UUX95502.1 hemerythrin domain-containing protein [Aquabacterium sp. J223]
MPAKKTQDAVALLIEDHRTVQKLFKQFEKLCESDGSEEEKEALALQICSELTVHAQIEEEIFYPAAREVMDEDDLLNEAEVEHASAKDLIAQIEEMEPTEELYDAKVTVLGEYVNHHVEEEESELFKQVKKTELDLEALGQELSQRKMELMSELGLMDDDDAVAEEEGAVANGAASASKPAAKKSAAKSKK